MPPSPLPLKQTLFGELESFVMGKNDTTSRSRSSSNTNNSNTVSITVTASTTPAPTFATASAATTNTAHTNDQEESAKIENSNELVTSTTSHPGTIFTLTAPAANIDRSVFELVHKCLQSTIPAMFHTQLNSGGDGNSTAAAASSLSSPSSPSSPSSSASSKITQEELQKLPVESLAQLASLLRTLLQVRSMQLMEKMDQRAFLQVELDSKKRMLDYIIPVIATNPVNTQRARAHSKSMK